MASKAPKNPAKPAPAAKAPAKREAAAPPALSPFEEMDLLFDRLSHRLMSRMGFPALADVGWPFGAHAPRVDLVDRGKELLLRAEIPGVAKENLSISLIDGSVTIRGETHKETRDEKGDYHRREISSGSFQRTIRLPVEVEGDKAKASFKDGVLELVLPKARESTGRRISID
jgi:HSP20 family protein